MDEYISKQSVLDYLNGYLDSIGECGADSLLFDRGQRRALINSIQDIIAIKPADVQPIDRWISVNDKLPEQDEKVLVFTKDKDIMTMIYKVIPFRWYKPKFGGFDKDYVTHWKPLPESPKGSDTEEPTEVSMPDGNCLDCKFQYLEDNDYWCSICPGNPEDV